MDIIHCYISCILFSIENSTGPDLIHFNTLISLRMKSGIQNSIQIVKFYCECDMRNWPTQQLYHDASWKVFLANVSDKLVHANNNAVFSFGGTWSLPCTISQPNVCRAKVMNHYTANFKSYVRFILDIHAASIDVLASQNLPFIYINMYTTYNWCQVSNKSQMKWDTGLCVWLGSSCMIC